MAETAVKTATDNGPPPLKTLADSMASIKVSGEPAADRPIPPTKAPGLVRRMSFTGRPIDIVRNALSQMRNECCSLFGK